VTEVRGTEGPVRKGSTGEQLHFWQAGDGGQVPAETEPHRGLIKWGLSREVQLARLLHLHLQLGHL